jgi:pSer/pThr/pTyr-binding forkhead associated (FHA) protein
VRKTYRSLVLGSLIILLLVSNALAQSVSLRDVMLTVPGDLSDFPEMVLYMNVADADNAPVADLAQENVSLYENGIAIPDLALDQVAKPLLISIVIDASSSLNSWSAGNTYVEHAKEAARQLVDPQYGRLTLDDEVAVFTFEDGQATRLPEDDGFTYDHNKVLDLGINPVSTAGNTKTALLDLLNRVVTEATAQRGIQRRVVLVFSDGIDLNSSIVGDNPAERTREIVAAAQEKGLVIYAVGLGTRHLAADHENSALLRALSTEGTGGQYLWYRPGNEASETEMAALLDHLVSQRAGYTIGYTSRQYEGVPEVRVVVERGGTEAEGSVSFEVPPLPPEVVFRSPEAGKIYAETVVVEAAVARAQRTIDRIDFYVEDTLVHTARAAPWTFAWDTLPYADAEVDYVRYVLSAQACDIGGLCSAPTEIQVGVRIPPPTPTPQPQPVPARVVDRGETPSVESTTDVATIASFAALGVALLAVVLVVIYIRRGGRQAVDNVVREVRRKTRVFRNKTKIFGGDEGAQSFPSLKVVSADQQGKVFTLQDRVLFLGRDDERADIVFEWDEFISRRHAKLSLEDANWYIWDLNSANGTWCDGRRVPASLSDGVELSEAAQLADESTIRLGPELSLHFSLPNGSGVSETEAAAASSPAPPTPELVEAPTQILGEASSAGVPSPSSPRAQSEGDDMRDTMVFGPDG